MVKKKNKYYNNKELEMFTTLIENAEAGMQLRKMYDIDIITQNNKWSSYGAKYKCPICDTDTTFSINPRNALLNEGTVKCDKCKATDEYGHWASIVNLFVN